MLTLERCDGDCCTRDVVAITGGSDASEVPPNTPPSLCSAEGVGAVACLKRGLELWDGGTAAIAFAAVSALSFISLSRTISVFTGFLVGGGFMLGCGTAGRVAAATCVIADACVTAGIVFDSRFTPGVVLRTESGHAVTLDPGTGPDGTVTVAAGLVLVFSFANLARYSSLLAGGPGFAVTLRSPRAIARGSRMGAVAFGRLCPSWVGDRGATLVALIAATLAGMTGSGSLSA